MFLSEFSLSFQGVGTERLLLRLAFDMTTTIETANCKSSYCCSCWRVSAG